MKFILPLLAISMVATACYPIRIGTNSSKPPPTTVALPNPNNSQVYRNVQYGFQLTLPAGWTADEKTDPGYVHFISPETQVKIDQCSPDCGAEGIFYDGNFESRSSSGLPLANKTSIRDEMINGYRFTNYKDAQDFETLHYEAVVHEKIFNFWILNVGQRCTERSR